MVYQLSEKIKLLVLPTLFVLANTKHEKYIGWKSYYVGASTKQQVKHMNALGVELDLIFLSRVHMEREAVVLVKPVYHGEFIKKLDNLGIKYRMHADDVKSVLEHDDRIIKDWRMAVVRSGGILLPYNNYQRLDVIYSYMSYIGAKHRKISSVILAGSSFEKRPIRYMKISTTNFQDESKPVIVIDGGIHAREWISPPTVTWAIKKLTEDITEPDLLNKYDWILIPVVNPDGYEFTFTNDRFWRKTRSTNTHSESKKCPGVDGNRNYDIAWNTVRTSTDPCSNIYGGNRAFSEVETQVVQDILQAYRTRIALYLSMHSYGSMILYPWLHTNSTSDNNFALKSIGVDMADAIHKVALQNFPRYVVGNPASYVSYLCSGTSVDYAHSIGIPLAYIFELPGVSEHGASFNLNPKYIEQVCRETWAGIVVGARRARNWLKK